MKRAFGLAALALVATLLLPVTASADTLDASGNGVLGDTVPLNTLIVFIAAVLVLMLRDPKPGTDSAENATPTVG